MAHHLENNRKVTYLLVSCFVFACTDTHLYGKDGPAGQADRLALTGRVCAEDTLAERLPLRIVIVADQAPGPLFASFDPGSIRIQFLRELVQAQLNSDKTEIAIVGFGGRSRKLAPSEGFFTRNPGELLSAINQLSISEPCTFTDECRDYLEGLRSARALIEGDLDQLEAGDRVVTQYLVLLLVAGPHQPMASNVDCCLPDDTACRDAVEAPDPGCQSQLEQVEVAAMLDAAANASALGLRLNILHLAAESGPINDQVQSAMREMAFAGSGSYQRIGAPETLSQSASRILDVRTELRAKTLLIANLNAKPSPSGPVTDSDADGMGDEDELEVGTLPDNPDTDGDSISDLVETIVHFDPLEPDQPAACRQVLQPTGDQDLDGLSNCEEAVLGTSPSLVDSDGDSMPDKLELIGVVDYLHRDADIDSDSDGVTNSEEVHSRTDPRSTDTQAHLNFGYRYEIDDEGVVSELYALPLLQITGVEFIHINDGSTPGVGTLSYSVSDSTLRWQDGMDTAPGPKVDISSGGDFDLPSSSYAPIQAQEGRLIQVRVELADIPVDDTEERVRIIYRKHHCITYTVRNIRLMDTLDIDGSGPGLNRILLFFAETPEGGMIKPGPFRMAEIPVVYRPPSYREPGAPMIEVLDEEFARSR